MLNPIIFLFMLFSMSSATQLFYPVEQNGTWCGPFKECPPGTQCMRLSDRSEPFSCFLSRFGSTYSFIEHQKHVTSDSQKKFHVYEPLPVWLLGSASFGILCAASSIIWIGFFLSKRLILFVLKAKCKKTELKKAESINFGFERESPELHDV